ncbi:MAG: WXG100 family type VII secretion target [Williamsia herbipolensis]|nr:WXG100 family type VII secretion target [Williamsia herbipolensis]
MAQGTNIDTGSVDQLRQQAESLQEHMRSTLNQTAAVVQEAGGVSIWAGDASREFQNVNARYQESSQKLQRTMQEVLQSVNAGTKNYSSTDTDASSGLRNAAAQINWTA